MGIFSKFNFLVAHEPQVKALLAAQPALAVRLEAAQTRSSSVGRSEASSAASAGSLTGDSTEKRPLIALKMDFGHFKS